MFCEECPIKKNGVKNELHLTVLKWIYFGLCGGKTL